MSPANSLEQRFQSALEPPPLSILDRLEDKPREVAWLMGTSIQSLKDRLVTAEHAPNKLFLCDPGLEAETNSSDSGSAETGSTRETVFRQNCLKRFSSFPEGTFQLAIACWMLGTVPPGDLFPLMNNALTPEGTAGLVCMKEGEPRKPLALFQQSVLDAAGRKTELSESGHMSDAPTLRETLREQGFEQERAWEDSFEMHFQNPQELFLVLAGSMGNTQGQELEGTLNKIRSSFCERVQKAYGPEPTVTYTYLGATAVLSG